MSNHIMLSWFCGGGGASLGAIAANISTTIGVELDDNIANLYRTNVGDCITADLTKFDPRCLQLPTFEERTGKGDRLIWQLSPPCQDFSRSNTKKNQQSERATVIKEIYWHEEVIQPDYIVLENVTDYKIYEGYQGFREYLKAKQYRVIDYILNAADFGVPQSRERLIMIAARKGLSLPTITKTHAKNANIGQLSLFGESRLPWVGWHEAIKDLLSILPKSQLTDKQKQAIANCVDQSILISTDNSKSTVSGYKTRLASEPSFTLRTKCPPKALLVERVGYSKGIPKTAIASEPAWTIRACLSDDGKRGRNKIIDAISEGDIRSLDTRAIARLQSFPDSYQWSGKMALDVRAIGNSVPPLLMQKITESLITCCTSY